MFAEGGLESSYVPTGQRGVVFLSSIPSNMRPNEVRLHLQQFGTIFRTKFTAFPKKERSSGRGIMPLQFKNGYVEFLKKEDAVRCADTLNGQMVATKKRRKSHGQLWNIRYLEGFAMGDLAEEREAQTRNRKELEHRIKEREKDANEHFRKMVLQKKQQTAKALQATREPSQHEDTRVENVRSRRAQVDLCQVTDDGNAEGRNHTKTRTSSKRLRDGAVAASPAEQKTDVIKKKKRRLDVGTTKRKVADIN